MQNAPDSDELLTERLRKAFPAIAHLPQRIVRNAGLGTLAIILGQTHIALLSQKTSDISPLRGSQIADVVRSHVTASVPALVAQSDQMLLFHLIQGQPLTAARLLTGSTLERQALAEQLGRFLKELHGIRVTPAEAALLGEQVTTREDIQKRISSYELRLFPKLMLGGADLARVRLAMVHSDPDSWQFPLVPIHADINGDHLLVDGQLSLQGVVDFGGAALGDPAADFARLLLCYGHGFTKDVASGYPHAVQVLQRAAVLAHLIRYDWLMNGLEGQGNHWFLLDALVATDF